METEKQNYYTFAQGYKCSLTSKPVLSTIYHMWRVTKQLGVVEKELTIIGHNEDI